MNKYTRINWENTPSKATPLTADNLNHMDEGIERVTNGAIALETEIATARGSSNSLGARLDTADANLAKKADKANTLAGYGISDAYTREGTDKKLARKLDSMPFDSEPKNNSPCYLTSGTVYNALLSKYDSSNIETGKGELTPAQATYDGCEGSFNYSKIGKTVTVALNITTLVAGKNYVQFAGLPFTAMTASKLSSIVAYTTANKLVNIRLHGSWLYISSPGTTFAEGEKINVIVTYIIG